MGGRRGPSVGIIDMRSQRDVETIEAELRRAFEQIIPFNRVLGLRIDSLDFKAPRPRFDMRPEPVGNPVRQVSARRCNLVHPGRGRRPRNRSGFDHPQSEETSARHLGPGRGHYFVATGRVVRLGGLHPRLIA